MKCAVSLLVVLAVCSGFMCAGPTWESVGPRGGSVGAIAVAQSDPNIMYAVGVAERNSQNYWVRIRHKSTDAGNTWTQLAIAGVETAYLTDVAVDPLNPSTVLVASEAGVFRTTDGGASWTRATPAGIGYWAVAFHPTAPNRVYAAGGGRVSHSGDGGQTWSDLRTEVSPGSYFWGFRDLVFDPSNAARFYAIGYEFGIQRTDDGGLHWTPVTHPYLRDVVSLAIDPSDPAVMYAGTPMLGAFKTTDSGVNWNEITINPGNLDVKALAVDPDDPQRLYAGTANYSLFVSKDGGAVWEKAGGGMFPEATTIESLAISPGQPVTLWAGCANIGLIRSTDRGETWQDADVGFPGSGYVYSLAANPYDSRLMYAATDQGAYRSADGGAHWFNSNEGNPSWLHSISYALALNPVNPNIIYLGGFGLSRSWDGGQTWEGGNWANYRALAVHPARPNIVFASTLHSGLQKSTDGGLIWTSIRGDSYESRCVVIDPFDPDVIYSDGFKSTDCGETWTSLNLADPISTMAASPTESGVVFAGWPSYRIGNLVYPGGMRRSSDGGQTWTPVNLPDNDVLCVVTDPTRPGVVYYGTSYGVFRSTNGGAAWAQIDQSHQPKAGIRSLLVDPNNPDHLLAGTDYAGIYLIDLLNPAPVELLLTSPSGGERMLVGSEFTIRWSSKGLSGNVKLEFSGDAGKTYSVIANSTENDGEYVWRVPSQPAADCRVRVSQAGGSLSSNSKRSFSLVGCDYTVNKRSWPFHQDGEEGFLSVSSLALGGACPWTAASQVEWITITSGTQGTADGVVRFQVKPNTGDFPRTGILLVAGHEISIEQDCRPCSQSDFGVMPHEMRFFPEGGIRRVTATVNRGNCPWSPRVTEDWIEVQGIEEEGRTAVVTFQVSPNNGSGRDGMLLVGEQPLHIHQDGKLDPAMGQNYFMSYYQSGDDPVSLEHFFTGVAFSNSAETSAEGVVAAYDLDGKMMTAPSNPNWFGVAAKTPLAREGWNLFWDDPTAFREGWLEMRTNQPLGVFFLFGNPEQMDGALAFRRQSRRLYLTRVFEGQAAFRGQPGTTEITVVNPNEEEIAVRMTLRGCSGATTPCAEVTRTIGPKETVHGTAQELFGKAEVTDGHVVVDVTSGPGAVGFSLVRLPGTKALIGLNGVSPDESRFLYSAQLATIPGIFTDVKLINTAAESRTVTLEAIDEQGAPAATAFSLALSPGESFARDAAELFPVGPGGFVGTLRVQADGPGLVGDVVFGDPGLKLASGLLMQTAAFTEGLFGHVAQGELNGEGLITGLALYNPGEQPATINIQVYGGHDWKVGERDVELDPNHRIAKLLNELMPSVSQQMGGYILIRSNLPIISQVLFSNGRFLSAVPPTQLQPAVP